MPSRSSGRGGGGQKRLSFPTTTTPTTASNKRKRSTSLSPAPTPPPLLHLPASPPTSPHSPHSPPPPRSIHHIHLGSWQLDTWHHSPYPADYQRDQLYVCEHCLRYTRSSTTMKRHADIGAGLCDGRVAGRLVYDDAERGVAVYEVDGGGSDAAELYCQCLCLLSKLFIEHKTVYYDVNPFLFYILLLTTPPNANSDDSDSDSSGGGATVERLAAYFSKEKHTTEHNNLACIVTLPHMQQKGYGRFLIQLSYQLTHHTAQANPALHPAGGPERPLSQLAVITYTSYWCDEAARTLSSARVGTFLTLRDMAVATAIERSDLVVALGVLGVECVGELSGGGGEVGVRVSRDVRQRMVRRVEEEEAKRVQRGDIVFDADCLRLEKDELRPLEEAAADSTEELGEADKEGEMVEESYEAGNDEEEAEVAEVVKKVRKKKGGKRRSVVVQASKKQSTQSASKRKTQVGNDEDEWEDSIEIDNESEL